MSEIEEEEIEEEENEVHVNYQSKYELGTIAEEGSWCLSYEERENVLYVAVWREIDEALSMDALLWTLKNAVLDPSSAFIFLIHVFPEIKFIPSPCKFISHSLSFISLSLMSLQWGSCL